MCTSFFQTKQGDVIWVHQQQHESKLRRGLFATSTHMMTFAPPTDVLPPERTVQAASKKCQPLLGWLQDTLQNTPSEALFTILSLERTSSNASKPQTRKPSPRLLKHLMPNWRKLLQEVDPICLFLKGGKPYGGNHSKEIKPLRGK